MKSSLASLVLTAALAMSIQAGAATVSDTTSVSPRTEPERTASSACSRFHPGHYVRVFDDKARNIDGLTSLKRTLSKDLRNFKGVEYAISWGTLEKSPGVYDFSRVDAALAQIKAKSMYLLLGFKERTFHNGCDSDFVPSHVNKEVGDLSRKCHAKIWEKTTMDHMIRVLQQIALRYKNDPHFLGISLEETAMRPPSFQENPKLRLKLCEQLKRAYPAVHSVAPDLIVHQMINWHDMASLSELADTLAGLGGGGAIGWPDTVPSRANEWWWYKIGRNYNTKLAIIPSVQTPQIGSSPEVTDQIYEFLVNDVNAHMIIWDTWHKDLGQAYLTDVVIPTVNRHNGAVKNTTCPW